MLAPTTRSAAGKTSDLLAQAVAQLQERDPAPAYVQVERGVRMLIADGSLPAIRDFKQAAQSHSRATRGRPFAAFLLGLLAGFAILIAAALLFGAQS